MAEPTWKCESIRNLRPLSPPCSTIAFVSLGSVGGCSSKVRGDRSNLCLLCCVLYSYEASRSSAGDFGRRNLLLRQHSCTTLAKNPLTSPVITCLPELFRRPFRLLDPNNNSSTLLPRETTLYFREPLDLADPAPDASLLASEATSDMTEQPSAVLFLVLVWSTRGT